MTENEIHQYIEMNPFRGHEPVFRGTSITINHILEDLADGMSVEEILYQYKNLQKIHIQSLFVYLKITMKEMEELRVHAVTGFFPLWKFWFPFRKR